MKSIDIKTVAKLIHNIEQLEKALLQIRDATPNGYSIRYGGYEFNPAFAFNHFGGGNNDHDDMFRRVDCLFNEYLYDLKRARIIELDSLGVEYVKDEAHGDEEEIDDEDDNLQPSDFVMGPDGPIGGM